MIETDSHLRLRLAARTLIEWKTPITAPDYQRVLSDLLAIHPNAKSWGLTPDKEILRLDDQGIVLWYLSETLNAETTKALEEKLDNNFIDLLQDRVIDALMVYGTLDKPRQRIWIGGPTKSQVADAITDAITSQDKEVKAIGFDALLTIIIPLSPDSQRESIARLIDRVGVRALIMQRMTKLINRSFKTLQFSQIPAGIALSLALIQVLEKKSKLDDNLVHYLENLLFRSSSSLEMPVFFTALLIFSTVYAWTIFFILSKYKGKIQISIKNLMLGISVQADNVLKEIRSSDPGRGLINTIGKKCSKNHSVLKSMLLTNSEDIWGTIALASTKAATRDVIHQSLQMIRDADIDVTTRDKIFFWLCRIRYIR